jgi:hypothetical protein
MKAKYTRSFEIVKPDVDGDVFTELLVNIMAVNNVGSVENDFPHFKVTVVVEADTWAESETLASNLVEDIFLFACDVFPDVTVDDFVTNGNLLRPA